MSKQATEKADEPRKSTQDLETPFDDGDKLYGQLQANIIWIVENMDGGFEDRHKAFQQYYRYATFEHNILLIIS